MRIQLRALRTACSSDLKHWLPVQTLRFPLTHANRQHLLGRHRHGDLRPRTGAYGLPGRQGVYP